MVSHFSSNFPYYFLGGVWLGREACFPNRAEYSANGAR